jgi:uncharacterized protein YqeY
VSKREEFSSALKEALKNKDNVTLSTVRLITSALKDRDINARSSGNMDGISEPEILSLLMSMIKQRQESSKTYRDANRADLADREDQEIKIIETFLPQQLSEAQTAEAVDNVIKETGAAGIKDMGKVMNELKARYAGQMDMGKVGGVVRQKLGA